MLLDSGDSAKKVKSDEYSLEEFETPLKVVDLSPSLAGTYRGDTVPGSLVTVVMPNLNKGRFIADAIDSVLSQTYVNLELMVVDNGSADQSLSIIEGFVRRDSRVTLLEESKRGVARAINAGLTRAKGEFVMVVGSDDLLAKEGISKQVSCLQEENAPLCYTEGWILDEWGKPTGRLYNRDWVKLPSTCEGMIFHELIRKVFVLPASVMYSRRCFENGMFDSSLTFGEDWDLLVRLSRSLEFRYIPEPLYGWRIYSGNMMVKGNERFVNENHVHIYEKWLRDFDGLSREDRNFILKRLLRSREALEGSFGLLQVAFGYPSAWPVLLGMMGSSISHRIRKSP
jgi:glycosyltransferase involved in cell wall biosynthesis